MKTFAEISASKTLQRPWIKGLGKERKVFQGLTFVEHNFNHAGAIWGPDQGTVSVAHVGWVSDICGSVAVAPVVVVGEGIMRHYDPARPPTFFLVISQSAPALTGRQQHRPQTLAH